MSGGRAAAWAWIDGQVLPADEARVSATDPGLLLGMGIFETCKVVDGVPFALGRHLARLREGAGRMGIDIPWDDDHLRRCCTEVLAPLAGLDPDPAAPVTRLRITVTPGSADRGGPTLLVTASRGPGWGPTADVVPVAVPVNEHSPLVGVKSTSRAENVVALHEARRRGADEAVLTNTGGALCEGSASNVFVVVGGRLCTPSLAAGCLAGVTRGLVMEVVEVDERDDLSLDDLRSAPEAFLTSTTRDVHPIATVDGSPLAAAPGPLTAAAAAAFAALVERGLEP